jgi:hypothetical protein
MNSAFLTTATVDFRSAKERTFAERKATMGRLAAALTFAVCVAIAGCGPTSNDLESEYGQRSESRLASSVNGYSVLADMFAKAGHTVNTQSDLTPDLKESADVIIYAPDDFAPPNQTTVTWFEQWLNGKAGRTLIYIGRDFDAAPIYWRKIRPQVPAKHQVEVDRRLRQAEADFRTRRRAIPEDAEGKWFNLDGTMAHRDVRSLGGFWSPGVKDSDIEIELNSRIDPAEENVEMLLTAPHDPPPEFDVIAFRRVYYPPSKQQFTLFTPTSQLIVVANGSFLVNLQLVNKEHRKLAGKLIEQVGDNRRVVFIEADDSRIRNTQGGGRQETAGMLDVFGVWPLSVILIQWIVVLALFCFARWPIFGPPRDPPPQPASDFSRHIDAMAETWELTRDSSYAQDRWQYYQQHIRSEPGTVVANRTSR